MGELLTVREFAKRIRKSPKALYADLRRGLWPHSRVGKRIFFDPETVKQYIKDHEVKPKAQA